MITITNQFIIVIDVIRFIGKYKNVCCDIRFVFYLLLIIENDDVAVIVSVMIVDVSVVVVSVDVVVSVIVVSVVVVVSLVVSVVDLVVVSVVLVVSDVVAVRKKRLKSVHF